MQLLLVTFRNEERNANNDGSEKSYFWLALYFFVQVIRVLFISEQPKKNKMAEIFAGTF